MEDEDLRIFACDIIQKAGILLKLPQTAITTAQMLLQRVYHTSEYTFDKYPLDITSMAALFLGAKIEEYPRKALDVIYVFTLVLSDKLKRKIIFTYKDEKVHEKIREELITAERRLLKNLGFNLLSSYPHKMILILHSAIVNVLDPENNVWKMKDNEHLLQIAWNYCNDSMKTDVFIKYNEKSVACACIQMACFDTQTFFPKSSDGREWYRLFVKDDSEVIAATKIIQNLYHRQEPDTNKFIDYIYITRQLINTIDSNIQSTTPSKHYQHARSQHSHHYRHHHRQEDKRHHQDRYRRI